MSRLAGEIFSVLVIALLSYVMIHTRVRQRRNRELNAWVQNQPVIYDCAVLVRQCMHPGGNWVDWSRSLGGGPRLLIRAGAIEVRAPQGMMLDSRDICLRADTARMWRDEVGWAGSALGRRECIHLVGRDETAEVELALSPLSNFGEVWAALGRAGIVAASSEWVPASSLSPGAAEPTDALWPDHRDVPAAPRRRLDIWLTLPLACFVVVGLYILVAPFSEAWNVGRVAGLALFAAVGLMRARHDRRRRRS
jgi:hypothetical protein